MDYVYYEVKGATKGIMCEHKQYDKNMTSFTLLQKRRMMQIWASVMQIASSTLRLAVMRSSE